MDGTSPPPEHRRRARRRILLRVLLLIIAIRIALPYVLLHLINHRLEHMKGYTGHVVDIDLALIRGAYRIEEFNLDRVDTVTSVRTPFLAAGLIDLSVEWKALLHGSVVGELVIDRSAVYFTKDAAEPADVQKDTTDLKDLLYDLMPLRINRVEMHDGTLRYIDPGSKPRVDIGMEHMEVLALNLRNSYDSTEVLPATVNVDADVYGGTFTLRMRLDPLAPDPKVDLDANMKNVQLTQLNPFMQAYANVDVNRGTFGMYTEIATRDRRFKGYVKPLINDLDVLGREDRNDPFLHKLWEGLAGTAADIFTNQPKDQFATKVEFEGSLDGPRANIWYAVIDLLRNAFIQALQPSIDHEISLRAVDTAEKEKQGFFKRLFNGDKDPAEEKRKEEEKRKKEAAKQRSKDRKAKEKEARKNTGQ